MHLIGGLLGLCGAIATLAGVGIAHARLLEERINVPVKVADARGRQVERDIVVTVFYDVAAPKPFPLLILNHGRAVDARGRAAVGRARFTEAAGFFAGLGFIVAVPTRVGYGVTGGDDVEDSGDCKTKNYPPVYQAAAVQTLIVMETLRERSYVAKDTHRDRGAVIRRHHRDHRRRAGGTWRGGDDQLRRRRRWQPRDAAG